MNTTDAQDALYFLLKPGRNRIQSSYALAEQLDCNQREIGYVVNSLRQRGYLVGSVHGQGYYLIETPAELAETIAHIENRKRGIDATVMALETAWLRETA
jgi:biotin operon repressor